MSRADKHNWYGKTKKKLEDYYRNYGFGLVQRSEIVDGGVPTRKQLDAMLAAPNKTDVPRYWIRELSKARDMLNETEQLPDGSEHLIALIDSAGDIEERAIQAFLR
jgi:hypothetical protein